jgi:hypothetical protein
MTMGLFAVLSPLLLTATGATHPACNYDAAKLLALPFEQFDQDLTGGWRALTNDRCPTEAAEVLRRYRTEHQPLTDAQRRLLSWHEGQVSASTGSYNRAIPLLLAGVPDNDAMGFADYALGTVAFMRRDKRALLAARARLAALPKPSKWIDTASATINGKLISFSTPWPPNLNVLDGLLECFDRPYSEAYSCRPLLRANLSAPSASPN